MGAQIVASPGGDLNGGLALINIIRATRTHFERLANCMPTLVTQSPRLPILSAPSGLVLSAEVVGSISRMRLRISWLANLKLRPSGPQRRCRSDQTMGPRLGLLGRVEEGRHVVRRLLELVPDYTIARARRHFEFDMNNIFGTPGVADSFYEGLRRSGVPE